VTNGTSAQCYIVPITLENKGQKTN